MKIVCAYSSLVFSAEYFPGTLESRESHHPVFDIPQRQLLEYRSKWMANQLTEIDSYLLFVAILKSTELVQFRTPVTRTAQTAAIVAKNMDALIKITHRINLILYPASTNIFPQYVISTDTRDLANVSYWISNWNDRYLEYRSGKVRDIQDRKDVALERLIKSSHRPPSSYSGTIAKWAAVAGDFPISNVSSPFKANTLVTLREYWIEIIERSIRNEYIFQVPDADLDELVEHCETNIDIGTIQSQLLFKFLRAAQKRKRDFIKLGDADIKRSTYEILTSTDNVQDANIRAMLQMAPEAEPKPEAYPSRLAYLKAKMRWDMAKKFNDPSST